MKQEILNKLENIHEAKTLIEINDLLGLKTADELRELQETLNKLVEEYLVFYTKKEKYILFLRVYPCVQNIKIYIQARLMLILFI